MRARELALAVEQVRVGQQAGAQRRFEVRRQGVRGRLLRRRARLSLTGRTSSTVTEMPGCEAPELRQAAEESMNAWSTNLPRPETPLLR